MGLESLEALQFRLLLLKLDVSENRLADPHPQRLLLGHCAVKSDELMAGVLLLQALHLLVQLLLLAVLHDRVQVASCVPDQQDRGYRAELLERFF